MSDQPLILVVNAGSSSIKTAVFDIAGAEVARASAEGTGRAALDDIIDALAAQGVALRDLAAAAHRVVHGGTDLTGAMRITDKVRTDIEACIPLAPLHNPHNLAAIDLITQRAPGLPQYASFDTAFHTSNPEVAKRYALPAEAEALGIRRYGFHGSSYASLVRTFPEATGTALPARVLAFHLGNGASIAALKDGISVATTMGYSPVSGITMGTRAGEIDANAVLRLVEEFGFDRAREILNHQSGLLGLSGHSADMRSLEADDSIKSRFAIDHFCHAAARQAGNLMMAMGGLDAIIFTGGIGENAPNIRAQILQSFSWCRAIVNSKANNGNETKLHDAGSDISIWKIPADEERQIMIDACRVMQSGEQ